MLLTRFVLERTGETLEICGDVSIEKGNAQSEADYSYPEFSNLSAKKQEGDSLVDYCPTGATWAGREYDVEDMIASVISYAILGIPGCRVLFMEDSLQTMVDEYRMNSVNIGDQQIPRTALYVNLYELYELALVTDSYIYYQCADQVLMLSIANGSVVSDNYFAEVGFWESVEAIRKGEEKILYGELPE